MQMMQGVEKEEALRPKRKRRGRKRANFRVPEKMPISVRALWQHANEEEQKLAHQTCATILEYWLGRASKADVMERLQLPALRVWQLSQQALSGMLAGLLKQPRMRGNKAMPKDPADDPKAMKKKIAQLERELKLSQDLIALLRQLPSHRPARAEKKRSRRAKAGKKKEWRPASSGASRAGGDVAPDPGTVQAG